MESGREGQQQEQVAEEEFLQEEEEEKACTSFGFRSVPLSQKQGLVDRVFHTVAGRYDVMNDLLSFGIHRLWKSALVSWLAPPISSFRRFDVLDIAGGTGDVALRIARASGSQTQITVCDINATMLSEGQRRSQGKEGAKKLHFVQGDACALPFADASFDAYTVAFGIRNVPHPSVALEEARRVLRCGGRFLCLEFSPHVWPFLERAYTAYSMRWIPFLGECVTGDAAAYRYLVESIRRFPNRVRFLRMMEEAGFEQRHVRAFSGGIVALYSGWKL